MYILDINKIRSDMSKFKLTRVVKNIYYFFYPKFCKRFSKKSRSLDAFREFFKNV